MAPGSRCSISIPNGQPTIASVEDNDIISSNTIENYVDISIIKALDIINNLNIPTTPTVSSISDSLITIEQLRRACKSDPTYKLLTETIKSGFPDNRNKTNPDIRNYWEVRHRLSCSNV